MLAERPPSCLTRSPAFADGSFGATNNGPSAEGCRRRRTRVHRTAGVVLVAQTTARDLTFSMGV